MARDNYRKGQRGHRPERRISVRGVRRDPIDMKKLAGALIALAQAQAEADALREHEQSKNHSPGVTDKHKARSTKPNKSDSTTEAA